MRVAVFGHSWVADRQAIFGQALRHELQVRGDSMVEYYPLTWPRHRRAGGLRVVREGDQANFTFADEAWGTIQRDDFDVVLLQQEPYCLLSTQVSTLCRRRRIPYAVFTWDNWHPPIGPGVGVVGGAAHVVCGNTDAQTLVRSVVPNAPTTILPQVGLDVELFAPPEAVPATRFDVLFAGRQDPMKGEDDLAIASQGTGWVVMAGYNGGHRAYAHMAERYHSARIHCAPSKDVVGRPREQFAPYATLESLLCGTPTVTTNQPAILEWTKGLPGVWHTPQGEPQALRDTLQRALNHSDDELVALGREARAAVVARFSNEVVAAQYVDVLAAISR